MDTCKYCGSTANLSLVCENCLGNRVETDIRYIRRQLGMNQTLFAHHMGVAANTVARWETGRVKPSEPSVKKLLSLTREVTKKGRAP